MKRICLNKEALQGRELNNEELIQIRGGAEMNSHYTCTFKKDDKDEGTEYSYYTESKEKASANCMDEHKSECTDQETFANCTCSC